MRRALRTLLLAGSLPLLAGCQIDPEDPVFFFGTARGPDGRPLSGATLQLERAREGQDAVEGMGLERPFTFEPFQTVTTRADGTWVAEVLSMDTYVPRTSSQAWGPSGERAFRIVNRTREDLPPAEVRFFAYGRDVELPGIGQWEGRLGMEAVGDTLSFTYPALPPLPAPSVEPNEYAPEPVWLPQLLLLQGETPAWRGEAHSPQVLPVEVLEDFSLTAQLRGEETLIWTYADIGSMAPQMTREVFARLSLPALSLPPGTLRPFSRGLACPELPRAPDESPDTCALTDGKLDAWEHEGGPPSASLTLPFPEPRMVRRVLVRGLRLPYRTPGLVLEVLPPDSDKWQVKGRHALPVPDEQSYGPYRELEQFAAFTLEAPLEATAVRVTAEGPTYEFEGVPQQQPGAIYSARELSVFE